MRLGWTTLLAVSSLCSIGLVADAQAGGRHPKKQVVRIGALVDQTGASTSPLYRKAVELAAAQMNEALDRENAKLEFEVVFGDTLSVPATGRAEAIRLINDEGAMALVSDSSGVTVQVNGLNYDPASPAVTKVPITCFQCSSGFINNPATVDANPVLQASQRDLDNWLRRVFYNANFEAAVLVQVAINGVGDRNNDGLLKVGILADGGHASLAGAIGTTIPTFYSGPATTERIFITSVASIPTDWPRVVDTFNENTGVTDGEPDLVVMAMLPGSAAAGLTAYRNGGFTLPIYSNNSFRRNYILASIGAPANGLEGSSVALVNASPSGQIFIDEFEDFAGQGPEITSSGAYDSAMSLMLAALVAADNPSRPKPVTPAGIRAALDQINAPQGRLIRPRVKDLRKAIDAVRCGKSINYDGAYDPLDWNAVGDIFPALVHWVIDNEQFVETEQFLCDPAHPTCPAL